MTAIGRQNPILLFLATSCHRCCSASCAAGITRGSPLSCSCCCVCCWSIRNEAEGEQLERARNCRYKNINSLGGRYILIILSIKAINRCERIGNLKRRVLIFFTGGKKKISFLSCKQNQGYTYFYSRRKFIREGLFIIRSLLMISAHNVQ